MLRRICQIADFIKSADFCRIYKISNAVADFIKSADYFI